MPNTNDKQPHTLNQLRPIYTIGVSTRDTHKMRDSYLGNMQGIEIGIYHVQNTSVLPYRIGIAPCVLVVSEHTRLNDPALSLFIRKHSVPVLKLMRNPVVTSMLSRTDFYGGVYDTYDSHRLDVSVELTEALNTGIQVWQLRQSHVASNVQRKTGSDTWIKCRSTLPKPEPTWLDYVRKTTVGVIPSQDFMKLRATVGMQLGFR